MLFILDTEDSCFILILSTYQIGIVPEHHAFDFRQPSLVQEFLLASDSLLLMEFLLLVKGVKNTSLFSFFFHLNPGFDVYIGNIKVFNFKQHGINDEVR